MKKKVKLHFKNFEIRLKFLIELNLIQKHGYLYVSHVFLEHQTQIIPRSIKSRLYASGAYCLLFNQPSINDFKKKIRMRTMFLWPTNMRYLLSFQVKLSMGYFTLFFSVWNFVGFFFHRKYHTFFTCCQMNCKFFFLWVLI